MSSQPSNEQMEVLMESVQGVDIPSIEGHVRADFQAVYVQLFVPLLLQRKTLLPPSSQTHAYPEEDMAAQQACAPAPRVCGATQTQLHVFPTYVAGHALLLLVLSSIWQLLSPVYVFLLPPVLLPFFSPSPTSFPLHPSVSVPPLPPSFSPLLHD
eukprot:CAMPEP_0113896772 /NCGR_PEP_ID=MMETSP0780_2-20120614/18244_1 /TAXON_ID=652834 /ORGANISM="Palpitomonas bilix" /LENGTH=154 /DNA_ID=CAMNT_0000888031 /DNA_START=626 /DNA_END=1091 /DNA_ORIENTATION=- /assembly_acc=CAM_ASM_000599